MLSAFRASAAQAIAHDRSGQSSTASFRGDAAIGRRAVAFITTVMTEKGRAILKDVMHLWHRFRALERMPTDLLPEFDVLELDKAVSEGLLTMTIFMEPTPKSKVIDTIAAEMIT